MKRIKLARIGMTMLLVTQTLVPLTTLIETPLGLQAESGAVAQAQEAPTEEAKVAAQELYDKLIAEWVPATVNMATATVTMIGGSYQDISLDIEAGVTLEVAGGQIRSYCYVTGTLIVNGGTLTGGVFLSQDSRFIMSQGTVDSVSQVGDPQEVSLTGGTITNTLRAATNEPMTIENTNIGDLHLSLTDNIILADCTIANFENSGQLTVLSGTITEGNNRGVLIQNAQAAMTAISNRIGTKHVIYDVQAGTTYTEGTKDGLTDDANADVSGAVWGIDKSDLANPKYGITIGETFYEIPGVTVAEKVEVQRDLVVTDSQGNEVTEGFSYSEAGVLTFTTGGDYTISNREGVTVTSDVIKVATTGGASANLTLKGVAIQTERSAYELAAIEINQGAKAQLSLVGANSLKANTAGILNQNNDPDTLIIDAPAVDGSLNVTAAVALANSMTIAGGTITAAGVSAISCSEGRFNITGGTVNASSASQGNVTIDGNVVISGGVVNAYCDDNATTYSYAISSATITGGTVTVSGHEKATALLKKVAISGGIVHADASGKNTQAIADSHISGGTVNASATGTSSYVLNRTEITGGAVNAEGRVSSLTPSNHRFTKLIQQTISPQGALVKIDNGEAFPVPANNSGGAEDLLSFYLESGKNHTVAITDDNNTATYALLWDTAKTDWDLGEITTDAILPAGKTGQAYKDGENPVKLVSNLPDAEWSITVKEGEGLPDGLTLNADGTITGTPTKAGDFTFTAKATKDGISVEKTFTIDIAETLRDLVVTDSKGDLIAEGAGYTYEDDTRVGQKVLTFTTAGDYTVRNREGVTTTPDRIVVTAEGVKLTLDGVNIATESPYLDGVLTIEDGATLALTLKGSNTLGNATGLGNTVYGIRNHNKAADSLLIAAATPEATTDSLTLSSGSGGLYGSSTIQSGNLNIIRAYAGLRVDANETLKITGGNIDIKANNRGMSNNSGHMEITGGSVNIAGYGTFGIQNGGTFTINGGQVTANASSYTSDSYGIYNNNGTITINDGQVTAAAYSYGFINNIGTISINGGTVEANGGKDFQNVTINGGAVKGMSGITSGLIPSTDVNQFTEVVKHLIPAEGAMVSIDDGTAFPVVANNSGDAEDLLSFYLEKGKNHKVAITNNVTGQPPREVVYHLKWVTDQWQLATTPTINVTDLPDATANISYRHTFTAEGDTPIAWSATDLPAGLELNEASGELTGTLTTGANHTFSVTATNDFGADTADFTLLVKPDKSLLQVLLDQAQKLKAYQFSETNWETLQAAIATAQAVYDDDDATQTDVTDALTVLQAAVDLQLINGSWGTAPWAIGEDGVLRIYGGTGRDNTVSSPWKNYAHLIQEVVFVEEVKVGSNANLAYLFAGLNQMTAIDLSHFNTANAVGMSYMFSGCGELTEINFAETQFDTSNVRDMVGMFQNCPSLQIVDLSELTLRSGVAVTNMFEISSGGVTFLLLRISEDQINTFANQRFNGRTYFTGTADAGEFGSFGAVSAKSLVENRMWTTAPLYDQDGKPVYVTNKLAALQNELQVAAGYSFQGWMPTPTDVSLIQQLKVGYLAFYDNLTSSVTFTAGANGSLTGETTITAQQAHVIPAASLPTPTPNTGYHFAGWFKDADFTESFDVTTDKVPATELQLFAKFAINTYTIAFSPNGADGSDPMADLPMTYNESQNLPQVTYTRAGYNFIGWNTAADGTGVAYEDQAVVKNLTGVNEGTVTLYAQWSQAVDKKTLKEKLDEANALNEFDYTVASWASFPAAIKAAQAVYDDDDADPDTIGKAIVDLQAAMDALVKRGTVDLADQLAISADLIIPSNAEYDSKQKQASLPITSSYYDRVTFEYEKEGVRTKVAPEDVGTYKVIVVLDGAQEYVPTVNPAFTISKRKVSAVITTAEKVYDGTTKAGSFQLGANNIVKGDDIDARFTKNPQFADKNVGENKPVDYEFILTGTDADNYELILPEVTGTITPRVLQLQVQAADKVYDRTTAATINAIGTNVVTGDVLTIDGTGHFNSKNVSAKRRVDYVLTLTGSDKENYKLGYQPPVSAAITPLEIILGIAAHEKVYDGKTEAAHLLYVTSHTTFYPEDDINAIPTANFETPDPGDDKLINYSLEMIGKDRGNYLLDEKKLPEVTGNILSLTKADRITLPSQVPTMAPTLFDDTIGGLEEPLDN